MSVVAAPVVVVRLMRVGMARVVMMFDISVVAKNPFSVKGFLYTIRSIPLRVIRIGVDCAQQGGAQGGEQSQKLGARAGSEQLRARARAPSVPQVRFFS